MEMLRLVRSFMLVLSFCTLQLSLLSGGPECALPFGVDNAQSMASMGMEMDSQSGATASAERVEDMRGANSQNAIVAPGDNDSTPAPCTSRTGSNCPSMAPCVFATLPAIATASLEMGVVREDHVALTVLAPPSATTSPDLPPPRA